MRLVVGITGATGAIFGIRTLEALRDAGVETHLILSPWGEKTIQVETDYTVEEVKRLAAVHHDHRNQAASISSGSFPTDGMIIAPCSMKTLAAITHGLAENLVHRAADVMIKERRKLVLVPRETPLSPIHLKNMLTLSQLGVQMVPPMPAFYNRPQNLDDMVNHIVARVLDQFGIENSLTRRWGIAHPVTRDARHVGTAPGATALETG